MHIQGRWKVEQANNYHPTWELQQSGHHLSGVATLTPEEGVRAGYHGAVSQAFEGRYDDGRLNVVIHWPAKRDGSRSVGHYEGALLGERIEGHCHDDSVPGMPDYHWHAVRC